MTRADEVRREQVARLAEELKASGATGDAAISVIAEWAHKRGARMPEPPAPSNPVSRETAEKSIIARCGTIHGFSPETIERERRFLLATAPALVADLAEAAKGANGRVRIGGKWSSVVTINRENFAEVEPAALVAALTRADAGGA